MSHEKLNVALIGAGRFGAKRASAVAKSLRSKLAIVADIDPGSARAVGEAYGCRWTIDWRTAATDAGIEAVAVATPTRQLALIGLQAVEAGKHVLVEKPCAATTSELLALVEAARANHTVLKGGYNHRFHPAIRRAHELFVEGAIGRPVFLRCIYGHGGRVGYENEWRSQAALSGGGELLDQGVHALDLFRWFLGEFEEAAGMVSTAFWPIAPAEDNAFVLLRNRDGIVAQLHASWTHWKNAFSFEVFGEKGYLRTTGLGGSYGPERLCCGLRARPGEAPHDNWIDFAGPDSSLTAEWEEFLDAVAEGREPASNGLDAWRTLQLAEAVYRSAREGQRVQVAGAPAHDRLHAG